MGDSFNCNFGEYHISGFGVEYIGEIIFKSQYTIIKWRVPLFYLCDRVRPTKVFKAFSFFYVLINIYIKQYNKYIIFLVYDKLISSLIFFSNSIGEIDFDIFSNPFIVFLYR